MVPAADAEVACWGLWGSGGERRVAPGAAVSGRADGAAGHVRDAADDPGAARHVRGDHRPDRLGGHLVPAAVRRAAAGVGNDRRALGPRPHAALGVRALCRSDGGVCCGPCLWVVPCGACRPGSAERLHHAAAAGHADRDDLGRTAGPDRGPLRSLPVAGTAGRTAGRRHRRRRELAHGLLVRRGRSRRHLTAAARIGSA